MRLSSGTRPGSVVLLVIAIVVQSSSGGDAASPEQLTPSVRAAVAPAGALRIGVYPGSPTSLLRDPASGDEKGLSVDLGRELARRLEIPGVLVEFRQIADVLEALRQGRVDFTVTNASPARAQTIDFSDAILGVELGYLVPAHSSIATFSDIDRPGIRVGVTEGGSSHATLSRTVRHAFVVPAPSVTAAIALLVDGKLDAYATNKAILFEMSDQLPGSRVLDGRWGMETFAIAIPKGRGPALASIRSFANAAKSEGLVKRAAERAGLRGAVDAP